MNEDPPATPASPFWQLLEAVPDAMVVSGRDGRIQLVNERALRLFGYERDELTGQPVELLVPDRFRAAHPGQRSRYFGAPTPRIVGVGVALFGRRKDGSEFPAEITLAPVGSGDGAVVSAAVRDVTERKRLEEETRATEARYQGVLERRVRERTAELEEANGFLTAIIENLPNMVFVKDAERLAFVRFNRAGEALLGVSREQLLGKNVHDLFPAAEAEFFQAKDRETLSTGLPLDIPEEPVETTRGRRWVHTRKVPILGEDGAPRFLLGISEDITEQRQAGETRARLAAIVESSEDAIIGTSLEGLVTSWNQGAERVFGYSAAEMLGKPLATLCPASREEEAALLTQRLAQGERVEHFQSVRLRKDGRELDVSVSISPIRDAAGKITGTSKIARDITEVKRTQLALARASDAAEAANRELESFSYSVAHDLRAPLRSIDGFSQALLEDYGDKLDAEGQRYLGFVRESAQQMAVLIDDLLALSRVSRSELHREELDLGELAQAAVTRLQRIQPDRAVDVQIQDGLHGTGDPRLVAVLLDNVLGNAWKFTGRRAEARIEFGATSGDGPRAYFVRDNGAGFDMAFVGKLFGVFQRLHSAAEFEGTGVGLATAQRVVSRHGGRIWAEAEVGNGATFYFTLQDQEGVA